MVEYTLTYTTDYGTPKEVAFTSEAQMFAHALKLDAEGATLLNMERDIWEEVGGVGILTHHAYYKYGKAVRVY